MTSEEEYFAGDELALHAWESKYRLGKESLDEFFQRITSEFVRLDNFKGAELLSPEKLAALSDYGRSRISRGKNEIFSYLFQNFEHIIPGGSVLSGIGSGKPVSLSNCCR